MEYSLADISSKNRDFSNPMYDALGSGGIYEVPAELPKVEPASAVLAPSSIIQRSSPQIHKRHREVNPATSDTGKDTQKLVEDDRSDC